MPRRRHLCLLAAPLGCVLTLGTACTMDGVAILPGLDQADDGDDGDVGEDTEGEDAEGDGGSPLDIPEGDDGGALVEQACRVGDDLDAALPCDTPPPSEVLEPVVAWTWTGPAGEDSVIVTPLVANLDDDNADGEIDLCDTPEIVVVAVDLPPTKGMPLPAGHIYVIDSETGETKRSFAHSIDASATPALADLDDDGHVEILAFERSVDIVGQVGQRRVIALDADGGVVWTSDTWMLSNGGGGLAIADLDADGSPEILAPEHVLSADGELLWHPPQPPLANSMPVAADLDGDGTLEVLFGRSVYAHDGTELFELQIPGGHNSGISAIANFDDDPEPEIYVHSSNHRIFEHDGTPKVECGSGGSVGGINLPVSIADTNADAKAELLTNTGSWFRAIELVELDGVTNCDVLWSVKISDDTPGVGTAFDLLADGTAEAIYADLGWVRIFDETGTPVASFERRARASLANPVVVDADNDGAAELIVVGSEPEGGDDDNVPRPSLLYIQNVDDRFAPTRRIWNQHAYHATNIREDATVPVRAAQHWIGGPNTFRSNPAPSYAGSYCQGPDIE